MKLEEEIYWKSSEDAVVMLALYYQHLRVYASKQQAEMLYMYY